MRHNSLRMLSWKLFIFGAICAVMVTGISQDAVADGSPAEVRQAVNALEGWLSTSSNGAGWRDYLLIDSLHGELAKGDAADYSTVSVVLGQFQSPAPGLQRRRFVAVRDALQAWLPQLAAPEALPQIAAEAQDQFMPPTQEELASARSSARSAMGRLGAFLSRSATRGSGWRHYLDWPALQSQLSGEDPDVATLEKGVERLTEDHTGLEKPQFMDLRRALRRYIDRQVVATNTDTVRKSFEKLAGELSERLKQYGPDANHRDAIELAGRIGFLDRYAQAPQVVAGVRRHYSHANLMAYVSADIVSTALADDVAEPTTIRDNILGTDVRGTGFTTGRVDVALVPDAGRAVFDFRMRGITNSRTVGWNRGVNIYSDSVTRLKADKRLVFDQNGLTTRPATVWASTATHVRDVASDKGRRIVERIAWKKVGQQKGAAEQEGSRRARQRLSARVDEKASTLVSDANRKYLEKFRNPLLRKDAFPALFDVHTSADAVQVQMLEATGEQLGAPQAAEPPPSGSAVGLRVHESLINNFAATYLGGKTIDSEETNKASEKSELLKQLKAQREKKLRERGRPVEKEKEPAPWQMTFAKRNPVTVEFRDETLKFTIRGVQFVGLDDTVYKRAMSMWAIYKVDRDKFGGLSLTLQKWDVDPTATETGGRFVPADAPVRSKLRARMKDLLEGENGENKIVEIFPLEFPGERGQRVGELAYSQVNLDGGWLTVMLDRILSPSEVEARVWPTRPGRIRTASAAATSP